MLSLTTSSTGAVVAQVRYYPYSGTRFESGVTPTDYKYTGQRYESALGLYDYGARYYDPLIGRFVSADSIVPGASNPQALNRYAYTLNNPLRYTDPTGHFCVPCMVVGFIGGGIGGAAYGYGSQALNNYNAQPDKAKDAFRALTTNIDPDFIKFTTVVGAGGGAFVGSVVGPVVLAGVEAVQATAATGGGLLGTKIDPDRIVNAANRFYEGAFTKTEETVVQGLVKELGIGNKGITFTSFEGAPANYIASSSVGSGLQRFITLSGSFFKLSRAEQLKTLKEEYMHLLQAIVELEPGLASLLEEEAKRFASGGK